MGELRFDDRVAVVTGAGSDPGLGRAYAMLLASRGAKVVVNDLGLGGDGRGIIPNDAQAVVDAIVAAGGEAIADGHSVADESQARAIVQTALDAWGRVDILVNNAGVCHASAFEEVSAADIRTMIDVHVMGGIWMCRAVWPEMRAAGYGRIVNTVSGSMFGEPHLTVYGAAKGGVFSLTRGLALEGAAHGIRVNAIGPGAATASATHSFEFPPEMLVGFRAHFPPELVAPVVGYLAHETCAVSGAVLQAASGDVCATYFGNTPGISDRSLSIESMQRQLAAILDPAQLTMLLDPHDPNAANRDTEGTLAPKPYTPQ